MKYLFIIPLPDSGSTFLQNQLALCKNIISFQTGRHKNGIEGAGLVWETKRKNNLYPRDTQHNVLKVYSEKHYIWEDKDRFEWKEVKNIWNNWWKKHKHFANANPRIFLEKTPTNVFTIDQLYENFKVDEHEVQFIFLNRNPYAVCEGTVRTCSAKKKINYEYDRVAKHWVKCSKHILDKFAKYKDCSVIIRYEDMVQNPEETANVLKNFVGSIDDLNFANRVISHSMDKPNPRPVTNYNDRHLANLKPQDVEKINSVLSSNVDLLDQWGYELR